MIRILKRYTESDEALCEGYSDYDCTYKADVQIQGETDSFGYETIDLCESCLQNMRADEEADEDRILEENHEEAPDGQLWLFTASYQDDYDWCCFYSVNKGLAVREKKREEERSAKHGGLYNPQIRLVPRETAIAVKQRYDNRWNEEW